jgi:hypothetical protein
MPNSIGKSIGRSMERRTNCGVIIKRRTQAIIIVDIVFRNKVKRKLLNLTNAPTHPDLRSLPWG